jgi:hypothetical protein
MHNGWCNEPENPLKLEFIMADPTIRTTSHYYPAEELNAMKDFYEDKVCVVTKNTFAQWAHMLDTLETSNIRVS